MAGEVYFSTEYGEGRARWCGDLPEIKKSYDVEIELEGAFQLEDNIEIANCKNPSISINHRGMNFVGVVESVDDDGLTVLRLGASIILFDSMLNATSINEYLSLYVENIMLFPYQV